MPTHKIIIGCAKDMNKENWMFCDNCTRLCFRDSCLELRLEQKRFLIAEDAITLEE